MHILIAFRLMVSVSSGPSNSTSCLRTRRNGFCPFPTSMKLSCCFATAESTTVGGIRAVRSNTWQKLSPDLHSCVQQRARGGETRGTYASEAGTVVWNCFICSYLHAILIFASPPSALSSSSSAWP